MRRHDLLPIRVQNFTRTCKGQNTNSMNRSTCLPEPDTCKMSGVENVRTNPVLLSVRKDAEGVASEPVTRESSCNKSAQNHAGVFVSAGPFWKAQQEQAVTQHRYPPAVLHKIRKAILRDLICARVARLGFLAVFEGVMLNLNPRTRSFRVFSERLRATNQH